jgi:hypothetical protein
MSNHEQSIGPDSNQPVDGIAGTNPGTQQPSGAHVDAGGPGAGPGQRPEITPDEAQRQGVVPAPGHTGKMPSGQDGRGVAQPSGITGVMGSVKRARHMQARAVAHPGWAGKYNGSLSRAGQRISVKVGCGAPGACAA